MTLFTKRSGRCGHLHARSFAAAVFVSAVAFSTAPSAQSCVVAIPESNPVSAYSVSGGTVTDNRSGLIWDQCARGLSGAGCSVGLPASLSWQGALSEVSLANTGIYKGATDWRLPNLKELRSLVEECRASPSVNTTVFPGTSSNLFWTNSPTQIYVESAWVVDFAGGDVFSLERAMSASVRLVRGGR